jgi:tRNA-2-methylthio-N6-dimethylallyladenosine synthase
MTYTLFITGCQQNVYDSRKITHLLNKMGYFESAEENADLIIVFACSVRQKPIDRIFGKIKLWKKMPKKPKILLAGCVLPSDKLKLKDKIDAIFDSKNPEKNIIKWLDDNITKLPKNNQTNKHFNSLTIEQCNNLVPIMYGCNNFCSYCAVPYTRGREISRQPETIIKEVKDNVSLGASEIMLLGQNVNSYKSHKIKDQNHRSDFVELIKKIEKIEGLKKISFMTSHPKDMSDDLIEWMKKSNKFSGELHLPVQSGDDEILKKMNRCYTSKQYINLVNKIKSKVKLKFFSTDIIVGFPTETKKQFNNTVKLCKTCKFDKAFVSQYSPRPGTYSSKMIDDVSKEEKKHRWKTLDDLINKK